MGKYILTIFVEIFYTLLHRMHFYQAHTFLCELCTHIAEDPGSGTGWWRGDRLRFVALMHLFYGGNTLSHICMIGCHFTKILVCFTVAYIMHGVDPQTKLKRPIRKNNEYII